ncbi:hypothetical protein D3C86_1621110 [compost metagenome]
MPAAQRLQRGAVELAVGLFDADVADRARVPVAADDLKFIRIGRQAEFGEAKRITPAFQGTHGCPRCLPGR